MGKENALAQLKDIHVPESIGIWPLAIGWYGLGLLVCVLSSVLIYYFYSKYCNNRAKKQALQLLKKYHSQYKKDHNAALACARISELLRRVALVYYPRQQVASLYGQHWVEFLNTTSQNVDFTPVTTMLLEVPFRTTNTADVDFALLVDKVEQWIKQRKKICLN